MVGGIEPVGGDGGFDLDLMAASLRQDTDDVRVLLRALVSRLSDALGQRLTIERAGGFLRKSDEIKRVTIRLGDDQLDAVIDRGTLDCTVSRTSGGIRIRSTRVEFAEWVRRLLGALRDEAATSQSTRTALESLVIGGGE
jgi:hypothetical protein